jgi:carboxypeptidase family protein/TonB-dependent receptor-like protein
MRRQLIWALALVLAAFSVASAQETTTGSITGEVIDGQGAAVPGATITLTSNQGTKTFVTDSSGRFFAPFLTPAVYSVRAELTGFSPVEQKNIQVRVGQRIDLTGLTLKVGGLEEVVEVVGTAPTIDTSSTTAGAVLESETLRMIPVGRNFTDTLYLVAGVSDSGRVGNSNPSVSGATGLENNYVVDGVNITNTGYGAVGSYSIVHGSLGAGVTTDFIKETQVKTAGFEAEYGQATGGVINVVTQSGSNNFSGSVFGYWRPSSLESDWTQLTTPDGTVNTTGTQNTDFGITLGGPIAKDRLFFFGAFNPQYQTRTFVAPSTSPGASLGEVDRKRRIMSYAGKLTWQASSNHRFDVTAFGDPATGEMGPQRPGSLRTQGAESFSELTSYGGHNQVIKYDGILSRNWLIEASVARATNQIEELPGVNEWRITDATVVPSVTTGGIGFYEQGNKGKNMQYQLKSTNIFDAGGNHQLRYGVAYEDINYDNINQRTGPTFTLVNGQQTSTGAQITIRNAPELGPGGRIYDVIRANFVNVRETTQKYFSAFIQDTWQVGKKLTLRPGVRFERQRLVGSEEPVICHEGDSVPGAGDGPGAGVPCEFTFDKNWGPRLGATYDFKGNGKSKLYASWGRFYAKIPNDLAARALSADAGVSRADYFDAGLTRPVPNGTLAAGRTTHFILAGVGAAHIDPNAKSTYQDEFVGGFEFEAARNVSLGVRYIHRTFGRVLEDIGAAAFVLYDQGHPDLGSVEYAITNPAADFPATLDNVGAFEDVAHKYDAVEVTANRAFSDNWSLIASYRWSKLTGNFEGFFRNDNGQSDPAISSLFDFPTNDPTYTSIGVPQYGYRGDVRFLGCTLGCEQLPNNRTHQFKLYTNRTMGALNLGLGFNAGSGRPLTAFTSNPNYTSGGEIPLAPRGSGLDTVDGFKETSPFETTLDAHVDYAIKFGDQKIVLLADVFNVFDRQEPTDYDNWDETSLGVVNPDFGQPTAGGSVYTAFQVPRQIRLGARFEW